MASDTNNCALHGVGWPAIYGPSFGPRPQATRVVRPVRSSPRPDCRRSGPCSGRIICRSGHHLGPIAAPDPITIQSRYLQAARPPHPTIRPAGRPVGRSVGRSVGQSAGGSAGQSAGRSVGWSVGRPVRSPRSSGVPTAPSAATATGTAGAAPEPARRRVVGTPGFRVGGTTLSTPPRRQHAGPGRWLDGLRLADEVHVELAQVEVRVPIPIPALADFRTGARSLGPLFAGTGSRLRLRLRLRLTLAAPTVLSSLSAPVLPVPVLRSVHEHPLLTTPYVRTGGWADLQGFRPFCPVSRVSKKADEAASQSRNRNQNRTRPPLRPAVSSRSPLPGCQLQRAQLLARVPGGEARDRGQQDDGEGEADVGADQVAARDALRQRQ